ncbi:non-specific lipid transfer protein GPI-anchored 14-like [Diospyros lotus]|uniref:non-specific lipid transfer protein GPI-anchored 14-like n=1 Tax=Diospyros lotus TaxID=55363 RepID=UPI00225BAEF5|nr:non-specific lipid transfer protein GPI-anchored 14-like [Diospyros lotus]
MDSSKQACCIFFLLLAAGSAHADLEKDRQECADQLLGLATCLPYVGGDAKTPTIDCCSGLKQVLHTGKKCLCILVKDRNDPNLGLKINATLALSLPAACHAPTNISECPGLLKLAPNSPDAKVFEDFTAGNKGSDSKPPPADRKGNPSGGSSSEIKSDGGRGRRWLGVEMISATLIAVVVHVLPNL